MSTSESLGLAWTKLAWTQQKLLIFIIFKVTYLSTCINALTINKCHISPSNNCSLLSLPQNEPTLIFPGGDARCISNSSEAPFDGEFGFLVAPGRNGTVSDVLFNLGGGGGCWDKYSTSACSHQVNLPEMKGILNRAFQGNPFNDWLSLHVPYCSGDIHVGYFSKHADWKTKFDDSEYGVVQNGAVNVQSALDWLINNIANTPGNLVISGESAGALGVQIWAHPIKVQLDAISNNSFPSRAVFIPDSYIGFSPDVQRTIVRDAWNLCENPLLMEYYSDNIMQKCHAGTVEIYDFVKEAASYHSDVPFAFIQSKTDSTQEYFFSFAAKKNISDCEFVNGAYSVLQQYNGHPNVVTYFINSNKHVHLMSDDLYQIDATGTKMKAFKPNLITWISLLNSHATTECVGKVRNVEDCDSELDDTKEYCHKDLIGKQFWVQAPKEDFDDPNNKNNYNNDSTDKKDIEDSISSTLFMSAMISISVFIIFPFCFYFVQLLRENVIKSTSAGQEEVIELNALLPTSDNNKSS